MDEKIKFSRPVPPFVRYCAATIPTVFDDSLSYYECLCALWKWLQDNLVNTINENAAVLAALKDYVENYLNSEEIQNAINNKLDEMAENGTLAEIINNYDETRFIFPKNWKNVSSSDANLIINQGKSLMIDVSYSECYSKVVEMLNDNGVTHLDYVVITHWDNDHIGNLKALIANGIIDSETNVYMPLAPSFVSSETVAEYQAYFEEYNIEYKTPTNLESINVGNIKVTFGNCNLAQDEQYAGLSDRRNLISTVLLIEHKEIKAFYSGDADNQAYEYLFNTGFVKGKVDLFKIGHHGFNVTTFAPFLKLCQPTFAIQSASDKDFNEGDFAYSPSINTIAEQGGKIYPTYLNENYLEFTSDGYNIHVKNGNPLNPSQYIEDNTDIYVDISAIDIDGDGSQSKPYKDIGAAFGSVNNYNTRVVTIHLSDGSYGLSTGQSLGNRKTCVWVENAKPTIRIVGNGSHPENVTINGFYFVNTKAIIEGVSINCQYRNGITAYNNSNININNCKFFSETASSYNGIIMLASQVSVENSEISGVTDGINAGNNSIIGIDRTVFGTLEGVKINADETCHIISNKITNSDNSPNLEEFDNFNKSILLYRGDGSLANDYTIGSITLPVNFTDLTSIEIELKSNTDRYAASGKIYYPKNGQVIPMQFMLSSGTYIYYMMTEVNLTDDNKLTFANQTRMRIKRSDGTIDYTDYPSGGNYYFKFINVRGQKERFNVIATENE